MSARLEQRLAALEATASRPTARLDGWYQAQSVEDLRFLVDVLEHPESGLSEGEQGRWDRLNQSFEAYAHEHA